MVEYMDTQLRSALLANAGVSLASGLLMLAVPDTVSGWLGLDIAGWLRAFGLLLVGHVALITALLPRLGVRQTAKLNFLAIAPYPFLLLGVLATGLIERSLGQVLALADALVIGAIAVMHAMGLRNPATAGHTQAA